MEHKEGHFEGVGGFQLYYQAWLPEGEPRAVLLVAHGLAEHSGRYGNLVDYLVPQGYAVYALDHRGHGRSQGQRVYVERFSHYLDDLKTFFDLVRGWHPEPKLFLLGHSMGGTISLAYTLRHQDELDGLILSGAGVKAGGDIPAALIIVGRLLSVLTPKLGVLGLDSAAISRDPAVVQAYDDDPLVYRGKATARLGAELAKTIEAFPAQMTQIRLPVLILHGSADRLANPEGSRLLYQRAQSADKTLKIYDGFYHEIFNDPGHEDVLADLVAWLEERV